LSTKGNGIFLVEEVVEINFCAVIDDVTFPIEGVIAVGEFKIVSIAGVIIGEVGEQSFIEDVIPSRSGGCISPFNTK
jgi:hypothetical protein